MASWASITHRGGIKRFAAPQKNFVSSRGIMNGFCSFDEAFTGPIMTPGSGKEKKKEKKDREKGRIGTVNGSGDMVRESFLSVPPPLPGAPDPDRPADRPVYKDDILGGSSGTKPGSLMSGVSLDDMFPLPGNTASNDTWEKSFTLEPEWAKTTPLTRPDGSVNVNGQPTLWRNVASPSTALVPVNSRVVDTMSTIPSELNQKLDTLTRQLESLGTPTPLQSTAELFLFVAIGLLILLAMDTLLRYASAVAGKGKQYLMKGGMRSGGRWVKRWESY